MNPFVLAVRAKKLTREIHHHSAYQIVLSNYTPFNSTINGTLYERIHGFLIKLHLQHFCVAEKVGIRLSGFLLRTFTVALLHFCCAQRNCFLDTD